ncbi:AMP-binding protein [Bradyrhizobium cenepequi]
MSAEQPAAVWQPSAEHLNSSNLSRLIRRLELVDYDQLLEFANRRPDRFWSETLDDLGICFDKDPTSFVDISRGKQWPRFFPGGQFNFAAACLRAPLGEGGREKPALIWEDEKGDRVQLTYAELSARTAQVATGLRSIGINKGDRVGLLMPNTPEAVIAFLAIGLMGAIVVPLYSGFGAGPASQRLLDAEAGALITADGFFRRGREVSLAETILDIAAAVPSLKRLVICPVIGATINVAGAVPWTTVEKMEPADGVVACTSTDDPFMIMYTSGTTGKPKGALHTHTSFPLRVAQDCAYIFDFRPGDRLMWVSDMGWMVGPLTIISALMLKGTLVLYDGAPDQPSVGRFREIAASHRVTHFGSAPTAIRMMAAKSDEALASEFPTLRILITAGEVIDPDAFDWYFRKFGGGSTPVINYTGGTEVSGAILTNVVLRQIAPCCFNSIAPGMAAGVVDDVGRRLVDEPGELAIFEPFVGMTYGFWNAPDRYIEAYWSTIPDTWVHGDLAVEHSNGQLELLGRSDDVMKIAGKRVGPSELEATVVDGRNVKEAYAVGIPDPRSGEAIVLFVVPGPEARSKGVSSQHAAKTLEQRMGKPYRPSAVVEVMQLPRTRNGKAVRRLARQAWLGLPPGNVASLENPHIFNELVEACRVSRGEA